MDDKTVRTVKRSFYRDANGNRQLLQVTEEQHISLETGGERVIRTISKLDAIGQLQLAGREVQESTPGADGTRQASSTVWMVKGEDLVPVERRQETERRVGDRDEMRRTVLVPDANGVFQKMVDTATVSREAAGTQTIEETTVADDGFGRMTTVGRTVTKITSDAQGQTRTSETFSLSRPGMAPDGALHRVQQVTTTKRTSPDGIIEVRHDTNRIVAGDSTDTLSPASTTIEMSQPAGPGKIHEVTILGPDTTGALPRIWVMGGRQTSSR